MMLRNLEFESQRPSGLVRDYNSTPPKGTPPRFRTLLGLIKPCILVSSLNPGGVPLGGGRGTIVIPYLGFRFDHTMERHMYYSLNSLLGDYIGEYHSAHLRRVLGF